MGGASESLDQVLVFVAVGVDGLPVRKRERLHEIEPIALVDLIVSFVFLSVGLQYDVHPGVSLKGGMPNWLLQILVVIDSIIDELLQHLPIFVHYHIVVPLLVDARWLDEGAEMLERDHIEFCEVGGFGWRYRLFCRLPQGEPSLEISEEGSPGRVELAQTLDSNVGFASDGWELELIVCKGLIMVEIKRGLGEKSEGIGLEGGSVFEDNLGLPILGILYNWVSFGHISCD